MTGICAGKRGEVQLADLIVADYSFHIDLNSMNLLDGSVKRDMRGIQLPSSLVTTVKIFLFGLDNEDVVLKVSTDRPKQSLRFRKQKFLHYLHNSKTAKAKEVKGIFDSGPMFNSATKQLLEHWILDGKTWKTQPLIQYDSSSFEWSLTPDGEMHVARELASFEKWPVPDPKKSKFYIG